MKIMIKNWKDTVIKNIKWRPNIEYIGDNKLDINISLPLTELFENQAKTSFAHGLMTGIHFHIDAQVAGKTIGRDELIKLFTDCGLPELANQFIKVYKKESKKP